MWWVTAIALMATSTELTGAKQWLKRSSPIGGIIGAPGPEEALLVLAGRGAVFRRVCLGLIHLDGTTVEGVLLIGILSPNIGA